jgi:hypothetical protein
MTSSHQCNNDLMCSDSVLITIVQEWPKDQISEIVVYMMWHEKCLWSVGVLEEYAFPVVFYLCIFLCNSLHSIFCKFLTFCTPEVNVSIVDHTSLTEEASTSFISLHLQKHSQGDPVDCYPPIWLQFCSMAVDPPLNL